MKKQLVVCAWLCVFGLIADGCCKRCCGNPDVTNSTAASSSMSLSGEIQDGTRVIKITARKFQFEPDVVVVNRGELVRLEITSIDVTHGFALKKFNIDRKLEPNKTEVIEFTPTEAGKFKFRCSQFCGLGHGKMRGYLIVRQPN